jgi:uncharacterized repeat protein (TIGR01451 family)
MKYLIKFSSALLLMILVTSAQAADDIQLTSIAEVDVITTNENGEQEVERQPAVKVTPGTEVIYTLTASNVGTNPVSKVVVTDPIPDHMTYVDRSAFGAGTEITFSVDGGKGYGLPENLRVKGDNGKLSPATASDYTHIRWVFNFALEPKDSAPVWFKARLN